MLFFGSALAQCSLKFPKFSTPHFELHQSAWLNFLKFQTAFLRHAEDNSANLSFDIFLKNWYPVVVVEFVTFCIYFLDTSANSNNFMTPQTVLLDFLVTRSCYIYYHFVEFWALSCAFHSPELFSYFTLSWGVFFTFYMR